jgi:ubiquitin carboxyl-terminal hydrolase 8
MNNNNKKELSYLNFEELSKQATFDFKNVNFNSTQVCNSLLKMYDKGHLLNSTGDEEGSYLLLMKFLEAYLKLRTSKLYKEDKKFVENMITSEKINKTTDVLGCLKENLIFRYNEAEKNRQLLNNPVESVSKSELKPVNNIQQIIAKKFIKPIEFAELMTKSEYKFLIIDIRSTNEYNYSHMNLSILLPDFKKHSFINIPGDLVENVAWKLEETIKKQDNDSVFKIFSSRKDYDYLILIDKDSSVTSFKPESKLSILKRALFEFEINDKLKNEPLILDGGWNEWINIYPGYSSSSTNIIQKETVKTLNGKINQI